MLVVRLQRTGRSGHAQFRIVVQDSRVSPTSGKVVEQLGHYNPHTKDLKFDKEKTEKFISNGAQPSERVAKLLSGTGMKLPKWVAKSPSKTASIKNVDKLRKNRPEQPKSEEPKPALEAETEAVDEVVEPTELVQEGADVGQKEEPAQSEENSESAESK